MVDFELLKKGPARALPEALGRALRRFMKDNGLSTREAGERLGIGHTNLAGSRIDKLRGAEVLRSLARCEDNEICVLAQALLERYNIPLNDFDFEALGWQLQAGAGLGGFIHKFLHEQLASEAAHRAAADELLYCFIRGMYFRQLSLVRNSGMRCTPLFPIGCFIETDYSFEPGDDPANYDYELDGRRGSGRFLEEDTFDTERIRADLTDHYLNLAKYENLFLLEAIENAAAFRQSDGEFKDDLTAACAAVEAYICYESMTAATSTLRCSMLRDRLLARTPLARIAAALHEHSRSNLADVGRLCEETIDGLSPERQCARTEIISYLEANLMMIDVRPAAIDV